MKKLYLFIAAVFAMLCTVSVSAQKYSLETEATEGAETTETTPAEETTPAIKYVLMREKLNI